MNPIAVIGAGFAGLSAASHLAHAGHRVVVIERLGREGGRAQVLHREGFRFDMGPSWYWMPAEHDRWFATLGKRRADYYAITQLNPSYGVHFKEHYYRVPPNGDQLRHLFEQITPGAGKALQRYLTQCRARYHIAMEHFIYRQFSSPLQLLNATTLRSIKTLALFSSYHRVVARAFAHPYIQKILSYPAVFLGSEPRATPAVYTLMNWIDLGLGSWYPEGGFGTVVQSMRKVAESLGVEFRFGTECVGFIHTQRGGRGRIGAISVRATTPQPPSRASTEPPHRSSARPEELAVSGVVASADYHHVEQELVAPAARRFSPRYWRRRSLAPSACNFYIGLNGSIEGLEHHTFFFDTDWNAHFNAVYRRPAHIKDPLFYLHAPSCTDRSCAPPGASALFVLIPLAPGLEDTERQRRSYFDTVCRRIEAHTGYDIRAHLRFVQSYSINDYRKDFNAYRGTAFGLGHTLFQTAAFRPPNRSRRVPNLYYCGQWTTPGTGTTMSMISGELAAARLIADLSARRGGHRPSV